FRLNSWKPKIAPIRTISAALAARHSALCALKYSPACSRWSWNQSGSRNCFRVRRLLAVAIGIEAAEIGLRDAAAGLLLVLEVVGAEFFKNLGPFFLRYVGNVFHRALGVLVLLQHARSLEHGFGDVNRTLGAQRERDRVARPRIDHDFAPGQFQIDRGVVSVFLELGDLHRFHRAADFAE